VSVLALDLGTSTGWALARPGRETVFGTQLFKPSGAHAGAPYLALRNFLHSTKATQDRADDPIHHIAFERPFGLKWKNANAGEMQIGLRATLLCWACHHQIRCTGLTVEGLKRQFTGNAKADKAAMIARARELGHDVETDHEADAIAVLYAAGVLKP